MLNFLRRSIQYRFSLPSTTAPLQPSFRTFTSRIPNYHEFHHTPFTFFREVLSCAINPDLINNETINADARLRAHRILEDIISVGSYSECKGIGFVRESVCKFIARMDGVPQPCKQEIILTAGAQRALDFILRTLITGKQDAVIIPVPHYPLYKDYIASLGGTVGEYRLDEDREWDIDFADLEDEVRRLILANKRPKAILIINPGNPTGYTLSSATIAKVIKFAVSHRLLVIADEVFRQNIDQLTAFKSCRSVVGTLPSEMRQNCELVSIHSISKGMVMVPGLRGGYLYTHNLSPFVIQQLHKFQSYYGYSNTIGQLMIDLMVNPFDGMSHTTKSAFLQEYAQLKDSIKRRGRMLADAFGAMKGISCPHIDGNMYLYPSVRFSRRAVEAGERLGVPVDLLYCQQIQQTTGTGVVAGCVFGDPVGRYHFRVSPCLLPEERLQNFLQQVDKCNSDFHQTYAD